MTKIPLYKRKVFVIPMIALMLCAFVSAAVIFATSHATVTVTEALSTTDILMTVNPAYPGETASVNITVNNLASVPLTVDLAWTDGTSTPDNVLYPIEETYTGPTTGVILAPNGDTVITLTWDITSGSGTGTFDGDLTLTRV